VRVGEEIAGRLPAPASGQDGEATARG